MPLKFCLLNHEMVAILEDRDRAPGMVLSCPGMSLRALECLIKLVGKEEQQLLPGLHTPSYSPAGSETWITKDRAAQSHAPECLQLC